MSDADVAAAARIADDFLAAQAALDLEAARRLAHRDYVVTSPGGSCTDLDALLTRLRGAYRSLEKRAAGQDIALGDGEIVVCTHGTMLGERSDGTRFDGVRFLDRLVVRDARVVSQQIWNDFGHG